jgi:hypothetical protein
MVGEHKGRLKDLYEINLHPAHIDPYTIVFTELFELPGGLQTDAMSTEYWQRFFARLTNREWHKAWLEGVWINIWYPTKSIKVEVFKTPLGYIHFVMHRWDRQWDLAFRTYRVQQKVGRVRAEQKARKELMKSLNRDQKRDFLLTNSFVVVGRSGVHYRIRHGRPTLAYRTWSEAQGRIGVHFLAALCLHPLGYYYTTFAGCMSPGEEMIAHKDLIERDEHFFWRKANQHDITSATAGIG